MQLLPLSNLALGDKRLDNRCNSLIDHFIHSPTLSIPEACGDWKGTKAAYRFFSNTAVVAEKSMQAQYYETKELIKETEGILLVAQDTTDCDYTTHPKTHGLGYLQGERLFGIKVHSALAMSEQGVPLGLLAQKRWIRDIGEFGKRRMKGKEKRAMDEKESNRWLTTVREVETRIPSTKQVVVIGDRESDIYALFALKRAANIQLVVRAKNNRYLAGTHKRLFTKVLDTPVAGTMTIRVQKAGYRRERLATLSIRYTPVTLTSKNGNGNIRLFAVCAEETEPPAGVKPLRWFLLTTLPVTEFAKARTVLQWYTKRWLIERFHYTLKSGCRIEELQLQERDRLERALAVYSIVAWKLLFITYEAREHPDSPLEKILTKEEITVLRRIHKKQIVTTIHEGVLSLAKLGGFLARKGDKKPGVKTLWIGIRRFTDMMQGWQLAKQKDVGKG